MRSLSAGVRRRFFLTYLQHRVRFEVRSLGAASGSVRRRFFLADLQHRVGFEVWQGCQLDLVGGDLWESSTRQLTSGMSHWSRRRAGGEESDKKRGFVEHFRRSSRYRSRRLLLS